MEYNFLCSFSSLGVHRTEFILYTYCILHKTVIRLWWLVCHSFVIWFQFCGFQLHQARLHIGFHIWLQRNLFRFLWPVWNLGTHTVMIFFFVVLYSDFRVRLPFVNHSLMPDFACLAHHKKLLAQFPKPVVKNHFSTSVNHKLFHYVLWFYVWFVWDMWLPLGASWVMWGQDYNGGRMACEQWIWVGAFVVRSSSLGAWLKIRF